MTLSLRGAAATWVPWFLSFAGALALAPGVAHAVPAAPSALAFHYGTDPPLDLVVFFERVVLDPARVRAGVARELAARGTAALARLQLPPAEAASPSSASQWLDRAKMLTDQGFSGFVLEPAAGSTAIRVAALVHDLHSLLPAAPLWLEAEPTLAVRAAAELSGLVAGPLFSSWDPRSQRTSPVAGSVREARVAELTSFSRVSGLPVVDVEAAPPAMSRTAARQLASRIGALGFLPWVAPGQRDRLGVGVVEPVSRRVLVLVDSAEEPYLPYTAAHRLLAMPLEYLGFAVDYLDIRAGLPEWSVRERYAGVVTWFTDDQMPSPESYERWLVRQLDAGVRVVVLGQMGFSPSDKLLHRLGLESVAHPPRPPLRISASDRWIGLEAAPIARGRDLPPYGAPTLKRHLEIQDADGIRFAPVVEADWGGMALDPYLTESGFEGRQRWIVDPFRFLASALALPEIPVPDPTTENGRRLLEIHVDGDGFPSVAELPGHPLAGEVILREFLAAYHVPTTVSIIEGEIGSAGLYPARTARLEPVARAIFTRPDVEIASHTFSHPFDWLRVQGEKASPADPEEVESVDGDRLDIPGYRYSIKRELDGSVAYINTRLAPLGKATRVFLWSGDALPPEEAIARADALGLENMNGDNAELPGPTLTLAGVPSFVRPVGTRLQIYAPAQNENVYTNLWHGPFYGFRRVIDYYRFTESPRRLKPIGIYYHFYSGTKAASVKALHEVYDWALAEDVLPVWGSEYAARVRGFEQATLARRLDGSWLLRGLGALRTVRVAPTLGWPDLARSPEVAGVRDLPQGRYVAFGPPSARAPLSPVRLLAFSGSAPALPYIEAANAPIESWRRDGNQIWFGLRGHVPVDVTIGGCAGEQTLEVMASGGTGRRLHFSAAESGEIHVICR